LGAPVVTRMALDVVGLGLMLLFDVIDDVMEDLEELVLCVEEILLILVDRDDLGEELD